MRSFIALPWPVLAVSMLIAALFGCGGKFRVSTFGSVITVNRQALSSSAFSVSPLDGIEAASADTRLGILGSESLGRERQLFHWSVIRSMREAFAGFDIEHLNDMNMIPARNKTGVELAAEECVAQHKLEQNLC